MSALKKLASQTAIYGFSTILVRLLNYVLAPLQTYALAGEQAEFGTISLLYAYIAFVNVIFMFGMETAFFRHASNSNDKYRVFKTAFSTLLFTTFLFSSILFLFSSGISHAILKLNNGSDYVKIFVLIIAFDTLSNIPFALLRLENKAWKYFLIKLANVAINVLCNLFFFLPALLKNTHLFESIGFIYDSSNAVYYVLISNLIASFFTFILFVPMLIKLGFEWNKSYFDKLIKYGSPFLIIGLAGMVNEVLDRQMIQSLVPGSVDEKYAQVGIYSACYKLAIFMNLAVQAFRMAAEPFFFSKMKDADAKEIYAKSFHYFSIFTLGVFLFVMAFLPWLKYLISPTYHSGLNIVPVLLLAYFFLGVYYNLSVWYKVSDRPMMGTYITLFGAAVTMGFNWIFIPRYGIMAAAVATLACYFAMSIASFILGQKMYPVPYRTLRFAAYFALAMFIWQASQLLIRQFDVTQKGLLMLIGIGGLFLFVVVAYLAEFRKKKHLIP